MKTQPPGRRIVLYFFLAYAITWLASWVAFASRNGSMPSLAGTTAMVFVLLGPALAALLTARLLEGRGGSRAVLHTLFRWRVSAFWWAFIFLYPLLHRLLTVGISMLLGGAPPTFFEAEGVPQGSVPLVLLALAAFNLLRGFGEETGWRAYALPLLQKHFGNALAASLVLGLLWALWHFHPANFGLLSRFPFWYILNVMAVTIVFTVVYNSTRGSLLMAIVFHMTLDVAEYVIPLGLYAADSTRFAISTFVHLLAAGAAVALLGAKNLAQPNALPE